MKNLWLLLVLSFLFSFNSKELYAQSIPKVTVLDCNKTNTLLRQEALKLRLSQMELKATEADIAYLSKEPLREALHHARVSSGIAVGGLSAALIAGFPSMAAGAITALVTGSSGTAGTTYAALSTLASAPALSKIATIGYVFGAIGGSFNAGVIILLGSDIDPSEIQALGPEELNAINRLLREIALDRVTYDIDKLNAKVLRDANDRWTWGWDSVADIRTVIKNLAIKHELLRIRMRINQKIISNIHEVCG